MKVGTSLLFQNDNIDMIEHWYDFLPAAWFIPEGRWIVILSLVLIFILGFAAGFSFHILKTNRWLIKHGYNPNDFFKKTN